MEKTKKKQKESDLGRVYAALSKKQDICVMPVRMRAERLRLPSDDEAHAILVADFFLADEGLMLYAPRLIMEAWFFAGRTEPGKDLPIEVHVPEDLISEHGGVPIKRMRFLSEQEYSKLVSEIQKDGVYTYRE